MNEKDKEVSRITQKDRKEELLKEYNLLDFITVYLDVRADLTNGKYSNCGYFCYLISSKYASRALDDFNWDLRPVNTRIYKKNYRRFDELFGKSFEVVSTDDDKVEPLIICRYFDEKYPKYVEISEEFRLFHNLYHDRKTDEYYKCDETGYGEKVAVVNDNNKVEIRLKEILEFASIKDMQFVWQSGFTEFSKFTLAELDLEYKPENQKDNEVISVFAAKDSDEPTHKSSSTFCGKRVFAPLPTPKINESPKYEEFIIGIDNNGNEVKHVCDCPRDPSLKNNVFYHTVFFKKEVLDKYYDKPSLYSVEDGGIRHNAGDNSWYLRIDNYHKEDELVHVYLGDLGNIPYKEQHYNVLSSKGISDERYNRDFECDFSPSEKPEHVFIEKYRKLNNIFEKEIGWPLILPLEKEDEYLLKLIRIPSTNEPCHFDNLILNLTKILIDSINVKEINALLNLDEERQKKGSIAKLETLLDSANLENYKPHIEFLRSLQGLRSSIVHRKGNKYQKSLDKFDAKNNSLINIVTDILQKSADALDFFIENITSFKGLQRTL
ncbi:MAG: hypothetical protein LBM19_03340 [Holosporales bacterium]|jgi:hypothetical protein|nr:hypothetical protein [Holosporales bacterium]